MAHFLLGVAIFLLGEAILEKCVIVESRRYAKILVLIYFIFESFEILSRYTGCPIVFFLGKICEFNSSRSDRLVGMMDGKIDVGRLSADALRYELKVRGVISQLKHDEMRCTLRELIRMEKNESFVLPDYPFLFEEDSKVISDELIKITDTVDNFAGSTSSSEFKKINTHLNYLFGRVQRSVPKDKDDQDKKSTFISQIVTLASRLKVKTRTTSTPKRSTASWSVANLAGVSVSSSTSSDDTEESDDNARTSKFVSIAKWGLTFSGDGKGSLNAFLERVTELRIARGVSRQILFTSAVDLFTGRALIWYRANRDNFTTWEELVNGLKSEFQPIDYDDRLFEEIKNRTQGPNESVGIYVAVMKNLFARLSTRISELSQVKIILRNLTPTYQRQLSLVEVNSVDQLLQLGKKLEATKLSVESYTPPVRTARILEPDLAYVQSDLLDVAGVSATSSVVTPVVKEKFVPQTGQNALLCWNCRKVGHRAVECREPRKIHCFRCGKPGVTSRNCENCSGNGRRGRR